MKRILADLWLPSTYITMIVSLTIALGLFLTSPIVFTGCRTLPSGGGVTQPVAPNEKIVVNAEKTLRISKDTFDLFLHLEKDNQAAITSKLPQVHQFAEYLRKNAPGWLITANNLKNDYKHGRGNLQDLLAALNVLNTATTNAQKALNQINNTNP